MLTEQEIFDKVASHLLKQGRQSVGGSQCLYRGPDDLKCAVGALIDDKWYDPDVEGCGVWSASVRKSEHTVKGKMLRDMLLNSGVDVDNERVMDLLENLQLIHDECDPEEWDGTLRCIANSFNLVY